uniref:Uncharacterized protein n=1 Tax=Arundo donax TaxID=35708 RepID=A0A0A9GGM9_ARUDO
MDWFVLCSHCYLPLPECSVVRIWTSHPRKLHQRI